MAKELTDEELLASITDGLELHVEGAGPEDSGSEGLIEADKKNSIKHWGCVACCEVVWSACTM